MGLHHKSFPLLRRRTVRCSNAAVLTANAFSAQSYRPFARFIAEQATIVCILCGVGGVLLPGEIHFYVGHSNWTQIQCQFNLLENFARTLIIFRCYWSGTPDAALYSSEPLGTVIQPLSCLCSLGRISLYARDTCKTFSGNFPSAFWVIRSCCL